MRILAAAALLLASTAAHAQDPAHDLSCSNVRPLLPAEFAAWAEQAPVVAGTEAGGGATIQPGAAVRVSLHPASHLKLNPAPRMVGPHGGTLTLAVTAPGTYRLALGGPYSVDLIRNGRATRSSAPSPGPRCSSIRKTMDFVLSPGHYTVQLSGSEAENVVLLAVKVS